ncbi:DUF4190 domain-containing protein [Candidatus Bipolaricaulota bacterium]|nr:DUF4190 domain-containing protein [Candidatus Bipolaricaulota bacterium]
MQAGEKEVRGEPGVTDTIILVLIAIVGIAWLAAVLYLLRKPLPKEAEGGDEPRTNWRERLNKQTEPLEGGASLICGIVSVVANLEWSLFTSIFGIILANSAMKPGRPNRGIAIAGLVLSIIGLLRVLWILGFLLRSFRSG